MKTIIIRAIAWGAGFGLAVSLLGLCVYLYMQGPKSWNTHALQVKRARAEGLSLVDAQLTEKSTGVTLAADVENTTSADITLPQNPKIMQTNKGTEALHGSLLKLSSDYFLPAHHTGTITLDNDDLCAADVQPQSCFDRYFQDQSEIVIFDETHRYEIRIPIPTLTAPAPK